MGGFPTSASNCPWKEFPFYIFASMWFLPLSIRADVIVNFITIIDFSIISCLHTIDGQKLICIISVVILAIQDEVHVIKI